MLNHRNEISSKNQRGKRRVKMAEHLNKTQWCFIPFIPKLHVAVILFKFLTIPIIEQTNGGLAAVRRGKFMRQVLVQGERGLFRCHTTWRTADFCHKDYRLFLLKPMVLTGIKMGKKNHFLSNYLLSCWHTQALSIHLFVFGELGIRTSPYYYLG